MATGNFTLKQVNQAIAQGAWSGYIAPKWVEYLVVAGGGGGGRAAIAAYQEAAGGAGAGGLLTGIVTVAAGTSYTVTVGAGGSAGASTGNSGTAGAASVFGSISAAGGGNSVGTASGAGVSGGSGAGANAGNLTLSQGVSGQGNGGGTGYSSGVGYAIGGGGGGAGTIGLSAGVAVAGNGGAGIASSISGSVVTYAGGGGGGGLNSGGSASSTIGGTGGVGGGGNGYTYSTSTAATSGGGNTGGGGGGGGYETAGAGGSGIVVVRYPGSVQFYTGGTVNYANGYIIHIFTASGTLAPTTPTVVSEYQISRSLRFNNVDTAYLNRTPASASNRKTWTWSAWVKWSNFGYGYPGLFAAGTTTIMFFADGLFRLAFNNASSVAKNIYSKANLRDFSAWYHLVVAVDTTQAIDTNRVKLYVNGDLLEINDLNLEEWPSQNLELSVNSSTAHSLGSGVAGSQPFSGYMTEVNLIDGQQLTPTSFGYVNPSTGVWSPAKFIGAYGTNGFYLNFSDNSNTTAATLGKDYSGNGNNWTPNNFSVTAGSGNDSFVDSPTSYGTDTGVGGTVRGNYCTWNPLYPLSNITNGNLDFSIGTSQGPATSSIYVTSGKWYFEITPTAITSIGEISITDSKLNMAAGYRSTGTKDVDSFSTNAAYGATWTVGDNIGVAFDVDNKQVTFYKNGASQGAITYTGSSLTTNSMGVLADWRTSATFAGTANFGQRPFAYTAPSGFKALCTQNLPTPTIGATTATLANKFFNTVTYTGTNASDITITTGLRSDFVWIKRRNSAVGHLLFDVIRGAGKTLRTQSTGAETDNGGAYVQQFNSNNFYIGSVDSAINTEGGTYVSWVWAANSTGASNSAGSITSTVSANPTSGFSVVTYTTTGSASTVGHGLGVAPSMIITKQRNGTTAWYTYHTSIGATNYLLLNSTAASASLSVIWNNTAPTSTVFSVGSGFGSGETYVTYCFAEVAGYSKFGSYTGNGSADGPFVYTGMRPAFIMIKRTDAVSSWEMHDTTRVTYNVDDKSLYANLEDAEATYNVLDVLSNGFKLRTTLNGTNQSSGTYIYMAFASNPFKYSLAR